MILLGPPCNEFCSSRLQHASLILDLSTLPHDSIHNLVFCRGSTLLERIFPGGQLQSRKLQVQAVLSSTPRPDSAKPRTSKQSRSPTPTCRTPKPHVPEPVMNHLTSRRCLGVLVTGAFKNPCESALAIRVFYNGSPDNQKT